MSHRTEHVSPIASSEITPREVFEQRRVLIRAAAAGAFGAALAPWFARSAFAQAPSPGRSGAKLAAKPNPQFVLMDKPTPYKDVTNYNNFYEFGTDKEDPA